MPALACTGEHHACEVVSSVGDAVCPARGIAHTISLPFGHSLGHGLLECMATIKITANGVGKLAAMAAIQKTPDLGLIAVRSLRDEGQGNRPSDLCGLSHGSKKTIPRVLRFQHL